MSLSEKTLSELLEQAKKLVMENKRLKDEHIMLERQVKGKDTNTILQCTLHDGLPQLIISFSSSFFFLLDLEENKMLLTETTRKAEQEALKRIEENTKLKDEIRGSKIFSGFLILIFH